MLLLLLLLPPPSAAAAAVSVPEFADGPCVTTLQRPLRPACDGGRCEVHGILPTSGALDAPAAAQFVALAALAGCGDGPEAVAVDVAVGAAHPARGLVAAASPTPPGARPPCQGDVAQGAAAALGAMAEAVRDVADGVGRDASRALDDSLAELPEVPGYKLVAAAAAGRRAVYRAAAAAAAAALAGEPAARCRGATSVVLGLEPASAPCTDASTGVQYVYAAALLAGASDTVALVDAQPLGSGQDALLRARAPGLPWRLRAQCRSAAVDGAAAAGGTLAEWAARSSAVGAASARHVRALHTPATGGRASDGWCGDWRSPAGSVRCGAAGWAALALAVLAAWAAVSGEGDALLLLALAVALVLGFTAVDIVASRPEHSEATDTGQAAFDAQSWYTVGLLAKCGASVAYAAYFRRCHTGAAASDRATLEKTRAAVQAAPPHTAAGREARARCQRAEAAHLRHVYVREPREEPPPLALRLALVPLLLGTCCAGPVGFCCYGLAGASPTRGERRSKVAAPAFFVLAVLLAVAAWVAARDVGDWRVYSAYSVLGVIAAVHLLMLLLVWLLLRALGPHCQAGSFEVWRALLRFAYLALLLSWVGPLELPYPAAVALCEWSLAPRDPKRRRTWPTHGAAPLVY